MPETPYQFLNVFLNHPVDVDLVGRGESDSGLWLCVAGVAGTVEVHLESKEGGFFLKHVSRQHYADLGQHAPPPSPPPPPPDDAAAGAGAGAVLSVDRFSVVQSSRPVSVRATYGPFSTKQTVPARYVVPDPLDLPQPPLPTLQHNGSLLDAAAAAGAAAAAVAAAAAGAAPRRLDVSAHIVRPQLPRDQPQLRVLFHAGTGTAAAADVGPGVAALGGRRHPRQRVCIVLHAALGDRPPLTAACSPDGEDGVCLAQVTVPATWWPPLSPPGWGGPSKWPPRRVQLAYSVLEPRGEGCVARVQIQPVAPLGTVLLAPAASAYRELRAPGPPPAEDGLLALLLPRAPLYPRARLHAPLFLLQPAAALLVVKVRVKNGLRLLGAEASSERWNVTASLNGKHTAATVTAFRRDSLADAPPQLQPSPHGKPGSSGAAGGGGGGPSKAEEVFSLLVAVSDEGGAGAADARLVLSARYVLAGDVAAAAGVAGAARKPALLEASGRRRHTARLEVHKDDIQAVLPISKNWEVMNTAVLTGHQVSQAMKVFIVSQAGKVADVTLQSACHSEDESVLKVSSSCSSVYVDGSEIRGSSNASVVVKYGTYTGLARFTVWMPEFPLEVSVADFRLSQVKGWRVPDEHSGRGGNKLKKREAADVPRWGKDPSFQDMMEHDQKPSCRLRFQQSPVEVYARFSASDQDSGRVSYFVNRRTWLRVTDLVEALLRVSDPRIASLSGRILQGRGVGRSEVQVLSPTGRVIGAKEVRVGNDKVSITRLQVRVVSGLQLSIVPDSAVENGYVAETSVTRKLTAQYQEGLLDIDIEFSDGTRTPLREVAVSDYHLLVESLDPEVVAFAPMVTSPHPRVIAVGEGRGDLLRVALLPADACRGGGGGGGAVTRGRPAAGGAGAVPAPALAAASAYVEVDFSGSDLPQRPDLVQNDGGPGVGGGLPLGFGPRSSRDMVADVPDISIGFPLKDENNHEPTVQARQHSAAVSGLGGGSGVRGSHVGGGGVSHHHLGPGAAHGQPAVSLTPLEIGMYVLLAAFCFAIVVFVVSCVVYASKFKPLTPMEAATLGARGPALGAAGGSSGASSSGAACLGAAGGAGAAGGGPPKGQEPTTTNAHDWVWLGRATLERASGHAVVNNNNNNNCKVRITANPLEQSTEMQASSASAAAVRHVPAVDSSTYCKKERDKERERERDRERPQPATPVRQHSREPALPTPPERMWQIRSSGTPPPLPPHGLVAPAPASAAAAADKPLEVEYRPPVPPHRNMGVTARIGPSAAAGLPAAGFQQSPAAAGADTAGAQTASPLPAPPPPPPHQQLQAGGGGGGGGHDSGAPEQPPQRHKSRRSSGHQAQPQPQPQVPPHQHQLQHHQHQLQQLQLQHEAAAAAAAAAAAGANSDFVPGAQRGAGGGSEVKRATIVGNPMFSAGAAVVAGGVALSGAAHDDLVGLDDLNLGMDYDQIMEYFDNLKESNA
ncbi:transmembrane protein 132E [Schistocerca americana]|uniref:transmembrane protein 132E n=1 Tax=Schistocerca americana TaxID=7009 RepID=UPI001F502B5F|nr:transmembrane protein 132E [Schistocerca americana]